MIDQNVYCFEPILKDTDHLPAKIETPCEAINALNLKRIIAKSLDSNSGYGLDMETAVSIADLYRAFLYLCKKYPDDVIVPTKEVDDFWHLHILDTRNYIQDCEKIFGKYLHHFPYSGLDGTKIDQDMEQFFISHTFMLMSRHFPELV